MWSNGKPNGPGVFRDANGTVVRGEFEEGCMNNGRDRAWIFKSAAECGFE